MATATAAPAQTRGTASTIAHFFGVSGKAAMEAMRGLSVGEKNVLAAGIQDGSLTY